MISVKEIEKLPIEEKIKVIEMIKKDIADKEASLYSIDNIFGCAKDLWEKDAQEYINEIRNNDRV